MKYLVCEQPGDFQLKEKSPPAKVPGEALLRIRKVGICGTDLHAYQGRQPYFTYPRILGHELAAEILEIEPNERQLSPGDRVVVMPYISCMQCYACRQGKTNCCSAIKVLGVHTDGGMQEQLSVPINLLLPARGLTYNQISVTEPLAIGAHAIRRSQLQKGETLLVMGCGPIGASILVMARNLGARVIAMDTNPLRLAYAREVLGIEHVIRAGDQAVAEVMEITGGDMAAVVADASGNTKALESGPEYMAYGGRYVLVGLSKGELVFKHPEIHAKETSLLCSRNATAEDFNQVLSILQSGAFPLESYITHEVSYNEMIRHFDGWLDPSGGVMKAVVSF